MLKSLLRTKLDRKDNVLWVSISRMPLKINDIIHGITI